MIEKLGNETACQSRVRTLREARGMPVAEGAVMHLAERLRYDGSGVDGDWTFRTW
jgi:hypothetical protein